MFQFPRFACPDLWIQSGTSGHYSAQVPPLDILGSMPACGSPRLIAACHVLHRFPAPRHPPFALSSLTTNLLLHLQVENIAWLHSRISVFSCQRSREYHSLRSCRLFHAWW